jgi:hypothetical protein
MNTHSVLYASWIGEFDDFREREANGKSEWQESAGKSQETIDRARAWGKPSLKLGELYEN